MKTMELIDIVISIYNQEKIIDKVLYGVIKNTTTYFNLILVFDGCTDKSMSRALGYLKQDNIPLLKDLRIATTLNVYETKANNTGFKLGTEKYLITIQDDMVIEERGWERRITYPLRRYNDVFSVTGRTALNLRFDKNTENPIYFDIAGREYLTLKRNIFAVRSGINRGPIAFRADILKKLNYLDELFAPAQFDEFDLVLRAYKQYGLKSGVFQIDYRSDLAWGKTRQSESSMNTNATYEKNIALLKNRHEQLLSGTGRIFENRIICKKEIDYKKTDFLLIKNTRG